MEQSFLLQAKFCGVASNPLIAVQYVMISLPSPWPGPLNCGWTLQLNPARRGRAAKAVLSCGISRLSRSSSSTVMNKSHWTRSVPALDCARKLSHCDALFIRDLYFRGGSGVFTRPFSWSLRSPFSCRPVITTNTGVCTQSPDSFNDTSWLGWVSRWCSRPNTPAPPLPDLFLHRFNKVVCFVVAQQQYEICKNRKEPRKTGAPC